MKSEIEKAIRYAFGMGILLGIVVALVQSCGGAHAGSNARAVEIEGPVGVVCYAIVREDGQTVGGNCLWAR